MKKNTRVQATRWTFLVYQESAPENFKDIIRNFHVGYAISPLHDPDPDELKAHYHIYLEFDHNMSLDKIKNEFMSKLGVGNLNPQVVYNPSSLCKYLVHFKDKWVDANGNRKHLYDPKEVIFADIPFWEYFLTEKGTSSVLEEIAFFVESAPDITTYRKLYLHAVNNGLILWQDYIEHNTYKINSLLR